MEKKLRMNRSIQAEGSFADVKEDLGLRRYQYRGKKKVFMQSMVAAMGRYLKKAAPKDSVREDRKVSVRRKRTGIRFRK